MATTSSIKTESDWQPDQREMGPFGLNGRDLDTPRSRSHGKASIIDHPVAQHVLSSLRNRNTSSRQFRALSQQLLALIAFEATRTLPTREVSIKTEVSSCAGRTLAKQVVFLSLTRHGIGLAHNLADFIPNTSIGTVSLDHVYEGHKVEPRLHLAHAPALNDVRVILFDPVVNTGLSAAIALNFLGRLGATELSLITFLITRPGIDRVQSNTRNLSIWTAAIDPELDPKKGPLPGLGNFAERLYGC